MSQWALSLLPFSETKSSSRCYRRDPVMGKHPEALFAELWPRPNTNFVWELIWYLFVHFQTVLRNGELKIMEVHTVKKAIFKIVDLPMKKTLTVDRIRWYAARFIGAVTFPERNDAKRFLKSRGCCLKFWKFLIVIWDAQCSCFFFSQIAEVDKGHPGTCESPRADFFCSKCSYFPKKSYRVRWHRGKPASASLWRTSEL